MTTKKTVPCDFFKLKEVLHTRGRTLDRASQEIGYNRNYLASRKNLNEGLPNTAVILLEKVFGIMPEDYAPTVYEVEVIPTPTQGGESLPDLSELYQTIYKAVYTAVKDALSE